MVSFPRIRFTPALIALVAVMGLGIPQGSAAELGKTLEEVKARAKSEGTVHLAVTWRKKLRKALTKAIRKNTGVKIKVTRVRGLASRERILNEAIGGVNKFDLVNVSGELREQYKKAGAIVKVPFRNYFPDLDAETFSPDGYFAATGFSKYGILYNTKLVPKDKVPTGWDDCISARWKGKVGVMTRPRAYTALWAGWGREKSLAFHRKLKANSPVWSTGNTDTGTKVATGEFPIACGMGLHALVNVKRRDPTAPLAFVMPKDLPIQVGEALALMKDSKAPNAAVLVVGFLASAEGQSHYYLQGRSSPFVKGSKSWKMLQQSGAKPVWGGWEASGKAEAAASGEIIQAWGFPKAR
ncbi:MAG: extracellular solute-binding protein [Alphaproteobacteria bacterium]|nr:extracellular solute-binding protein [Alphaproteobacteria bacterium]